jgi:hypothetical protein
MTILAPGPSEILVETRLDVAIAPTVAKPPQRIDEPPRLPKRLSRGAARLVIVAGLICTVAIGGYLVRLPGTYWSEVQVVFLPPISDKNPNSLQTGGTSLITFAGVVAQEVGSSTPITTVSDSVSLVSAGVKHGYQVRLPNDGGQWSNNFDKQYLDVQATGSTPQEVASTMQMVLAKISTALATTQSEAGVDKTNLIYTSQSPPSIPLYYQTGSHVRELIAISILGIGFSAAAAGLVNRRRRAWFQFHSPV